MKWIENDKILKLIALLIAVVLWLYVGTQQDPLFQRTYEVNLEMTNLAVDKTATLSQKTVKVRVFGRQDRLNSLSGSDFKATVDLSHAKKGTSTLPVELTLPSEVYFARTEPKTVDVEVSDKDGSEMAVETVTTGALPEGVTLSKISVKPERVFVTGDPNALATVDHIGVAVDLSSIYEDSETTQEILFYDADGALIQGADLEALPGSVSLQIDVDEREITKSVPVEANLTGRLPAGYTLDSATVTPETVSVTGSPKELANVTSVETQAIDLSGITASTERTVQLASALTPDTTSVTVTLTVSETENNNNGQQMTTTVPVSLAGAAAGTVSADVQSVEVTYHMADGYSADGASISATVLVSAAPGAAMTAQVQVVGSAGVIIDGVSPTTVTLTPNGTTSQPTNSQTDQ